MLTHVLQPDTQAILLLCSSFGQNLQNQTKPLTLGEYNTLAGWLRENDMTPQDLLNPTVKKRLPQNGIGKLDSTRLVALLERGMMLSLSVEKWTDRGIWVLGRGDSQYPKRLKQNLRHLSPPILYGVGNIQLLEMGGLAVVGSRNVDEEGLKYTHKVVQACAQQEIQIVSGGAKGVDIAAMQGALEEGGTAIGVLADSLMKAAVNAKYRTGIKEGRLSLVSAFDPNSGFSVGNAMGRNKYIYALADYALAISSDVGKGGTWAGAIEALEKIKNVPVLVRMQGTIPQGNYQLIEKGAKPFPEAPWNQSLRELMAATISKVEPTKMKMEAKSPETADIFIERLSSSAKVKLTNIEKPEIPSSSVVNELSENITDTRLQFLDSPKDIYEAVLPFILYHLKQPKDINSLAKCLNVRTTQMQDWLNRAIAEGKVRKNKKPVTYEVN